LGKVKGNAMDENLKTLQEWKDKIALREAVLEAAMAWYESSIAPRPAGVSHTEEMEEYEQLERDLHDAIHKLREVVKK
jgi:hypothetical protein